MLDLVIACLGQMGGAFITGTILGLLVMSFIVHDVKRGNGE